MSKFTKDEQTEIVKQALELETAILNGQKRLSTLQAERFRSAPNTPQRKLVNKPAPVVPDYSALPQVNYTMAQFLQDDIKEKPTFQNKVFSAHPFRRALIVMIVSVVLMEIFYSRAPLLSILLGILASTSFGIAAIYWYFRRQDYKKKKVEVENALMQSAEYINAKAIADQAAQERQAEIDEQLRVQQEKLDQEYAKEKSHFDTVVMPKYKSELAAWTEKHDMEIEEVAEKLQADRNAQANLYETTKVIPLQYRRVEALTYIHHLMSTSDYDIKEAVDMYDKEIQRQQEAKRIEELQRANALADEQNYRLSQQNALLDEQNYLQAQQNEIAEQQRRDDRRREIETEYHRHQVRKQWKNK